MYSIRSITLKLALISVLFVSCGSQEQASNIKYYGHDSYEANFEYSTYFEIPMEEITGKFKADGKNYKFTKKDMKHIQELMELHIKHLYGVLTYHEEPTNFASWSGGIRSAGTSKVLEVKQMVRSKNIRVQYSYKDKGVFYEDLFWDSKKLSLEFYMPNLPGRIYKDTLPKNAKKDPKTKEPIHPCTYKGDPSEAAFWYYWNPKNKGCQTKEFLKHTHKVKGKFSALDSTESTFPEYSRLYDESKRNGKPLIVHVMVGMDTKMTDKFDLGWLSYQNTVLKLEAMKNRSGVSVFKKTIGSHKKRQTIFKLNSGELNAEVHLEFVDPDEEDFDKVASSTMAKSDVFIFSGHSADGYYFDANRIFKAKPLPKSKYQIFYFNMCSTYSLYHSQYFKHKKSKWDSKGTKNLDVLTNAIGQPFLADKKTPYPKKPNGDVILIGSLFGRKANGRKLKTLPSWQAILGDMTDTAGFDLSGLTNILGDEDNPEVLEGSLVVPTLK